MNVLNSILKTRVILTDIGAAGAPTERRRKGTVRRRIGQSGQRRMGAHTALFDRPRVVVGERHRIRFRTRRRLEI